jgi:hypothetical protein
MNEAEMNAYMEPVAELVDRVLARHVVCDACYCGAHADCIGQGCFCDCQLEGL